MHAYFTMIEVMKITLLIAITCLSLNTFSQEECTLNSEAIKGNLSGAKTVREKHGVTETLTLKNGVKITYQMGGCAHYAYSFTYENFGAEKLTEKKAILLLAEKLLRATPVKDTSQSERFFQSMKEAGNSKDKSESGILNLPCGDANCSIDVSEKGKLRIGYDFAL